MKPKNQELVKAYPDKKTNLSQEATKRATLDGDRLRGLEELTVCPVSHERMRDPVMLMQSGITYDREHLCQSLLHFPTKDPKSNVEYKVPLEYAPNYNARGVLTALHGDEAFEEFNDSSFKAEYGQVWEKAMLERLERGALPFETVRLLAERGHAIAQYELGVAYDDSTMEDYEGAVDKDFDAARMWYRKAADQEHAVAQNNLGHLYDEGKDGVEEPNHKLAVHWWTKAAEHGDASAQCSLGWANYKGEGVKQNHKLAVKWWRKAAEKGYAGVQYNLGFAYYQGVGVKQSPEVAVEWWEEAAVQGHALAQYCLGCAYEKGTGVQKNLDLALKWYQHAADQGHSCAKEKVKALSLKRSQMN